MADEYHDPLVAPFLQILQQPFLSGGIKCRRCLIEHYNWPILKYRPGDSEPLSLAARQPLSHGAKFSIEPSGKA